MIVNLPFGDGKVAADLRSMKVRPLAPMAPACRGATAGTVASALDRPVAGPSLVELATGRRSAVVVIPDATRKIDLPAILPQILSRLERGGIAGASTTLLVACGTHPGVGETALRALTGPLPTGLRVLEHDCRDPEALVEVGSLRPGIPLRLNRLVVETDLLVTIGGVRHHYFAGFGGGPKMIFPGVAGHDEIQANHSLVLTGDTEGNPSRHPGCEPGQLVGNPVAEEIAGAASRRPPDMAVCLVEGRDGGVAWAAAGPWQTAFGAAVEQARAWFEIAGPSDLGLMVASGGGAPTDSTLIQAHKALDAACRFLVPGGSLLLVAAIDRGPGSDAMRPFLENPHPKEILKMLSNRWIQYGHTTLRIVEKTARYRVFLHSALDESIARRLGFQPAPSVEDILDGWRCDHAGKAVGVMTAGTVYPRA